jgi:hypothetical protein
MVHFLSTVATTIILCRTSLALGLKVKGMKTNVISTYDDNDDDDK